MSGTQRLAKVLGVPQTYSWGTQGSASLVAATHQASDPNFTPNPSTPYAELWFGAHPSAPSQVAHNDTTTDLVNWLGESKLPYLFKVLSIAKPLSLQLHPDEENAARLHKEDPQHYKDPHSKPEMAVALSDPFEALCGFRKHRVIMMLADSIPGFAKVIRPAAAAPAQTTSSATETTEAAAPAAAEKADAKEAAPAPTAEAAATTTTPPPTADPNMDESEFLRIMMKTLYEAPADLVKTAIDEVLAMDAECALPTMKKDHKLFGNAFSKFMNLLKDEDPIETLRSTLRLFRRFHEFFPYDRGCFAAFFLTYVRLRPGEAIFLGPNTIHAYIAGNCLEVMQTSDNVIRAGLTEKFTDVARLLELVSYKSFNLPSAMVKPLDVSMKFEGGYAASLKALVPLSTEAFRFYLLRLGTGMSLKDLRIPSWSPMMLFATHGTGSLKMEDSDQMTTITAGQCWIADGWHRMSIKNAGEKTEAEDAREKRLITLSADTLAEEQARNGMLEIVIVMPNLESGRLRRSNKDLKSGSSLSASPPPAAEETTEAPAKLSVEAFPQVTPPEAENEVAVAETTDEVPVKAETTAAAEGEKIEPVTPDTAADAQEGGEKKEKRKHRGIGQALRSLASARRERKAAKADHSAQATPTVTVEAPATSTDSEGSKEKMESSVTPAAADAKETTAPASSSAAKAETSTPVVSPALDCSTPLEPPALECSLPVEPPALECSLPVEPPALECSSPPVEPPALDCSLPVEPPALECSLPVEPPALECSSPPVEPPALECSLPVDPPALECSLPVEPPALECSLPVEPPALECSLPVEPTPGLSEVAPVAASAAATAVADKNSEAPVEKKGSVVKKESTMEKKASVTEKKASVMEKKTSQMEKKTSVAEKKGSVVKKDSAVKVATSTPKSQEKPSEAAAPAAEATKTVTTTTPQSKGTPSEGVSKKKSGVEGVAKTVSMGKGVKEGEVAAKPMGRVAAAAAAISGKKVDAPGSARGGKSPLGASKTMTPKSSGRVSSSLKRTASGGGAVDNVATAPGSPVGA